MLSILYSGAKLKNPMHLSVHFTQLPQDLGSHSPERHPVTLPNPPLGTLRRHLHILLYLGTQTLLASILRKFTATLSYLANTIVLSLNHPALAGKALLSWSLFSQSAKHSFGRSANVILGHTVPRT